MDDEPFIRDSVSSILSSKNLAVDTAADGTAAIELASQRDYDVAVVDMSMPGLSGMETIRRLKQVSPEIEAIVFTGHATLDVALEALHEQVFDFLCKPEGMKTIAMRVEQAIYRRNLIRKNEILLRDLEKERSRLWDELTATGRVSAPAGDSADFLQMVIDAIPEVTIVVDRDHQIVLANRAANEKAGGDPVSSGTKCYQLTQGQDTPCHRGSDRCCLNRVLATRRPHVEEMTVPNGKSGQLQVEVRAAPIFNDAGEVVQVVESYRDITERSELKRGLTAAKRALEHQLSSSDLLLGDSELMRGVRHLIAEVAPTDMTVLIRGESGTGKNVVAQLIHDLSGRKDMGHYVSVNCPAIPESLLESEMFGHERGAFTGAVERKPGRFELAAKGTILLDEIGLIPVSVQAKLLQIIDHKEFLRVGGSRLVHVDVRILAATNSQLEEMIDAGGFRTDLYYRLNQFPIHLPPLRDRFEDIPALTQHFLAKASVAQRREMPMISTEDMERLMAYHWPGNVRELKTVVDRFVLTQNLDVPTATGPVPLVARVTAHTGPRAVTHTEDPEIVALRHALADCHWNQKSAAKLLGIGYGALRYKMAKYGIQKPSISYSPEAK